MNRREALKSVAFLMGSAISATTMGVLFESFTLPEKEKNRVFFSASDEEVLAEFADIIIPTTASSPGAKAAGLGAFIPMMIKDCYPAQMQEIFASGMKDMQATGGGGMFGMGGFPEMYNLVVNSNSEFATKILANENVEEKSSQIKYALDLAKLSQNLLKGKELTDFIQRSYKQL